MTKLKSIYMLSWQTESSDRGQDGFWDRPLTKEEQHGYFKENYPDDYDEDGNRYIYWEMIELKKNKTPKPLSKSKWTEGF